MSIPLRIWYALDWRKGFSWARWRLYGFTR